jgi:dihydropteroate synthase
MGVINATPDSFSDGGVHFDAGVAVEAALAMFSAGADIVDVGGESTRPGADPIDPDEELRRTIPVITEIQRQAPDGVVSIDTRRSVVAQAAIEAGAQIINDISGFRDDPRLVEVARDSAAGVVVMHMLGKPRTMQREIHYENFPGDVYEFLKERISSLENAGIAPDKIIIDPGVGFGKTFDQNLTLINRLDYFRSLGKPVLIGPSRKAFLGAILNEPVAARRGVGTLGAVAASVFRGADVIRVHDAAEAVQVCRVVESILRERVNA